MASRLEPRRVLHPSRERLAFFGTVRDDSDWLTRFLVLDSDWLPTRVWFWAKCGFFLNVLRQGIVRLKVLGYGIDRLNVLRYGIVRLNVLR